MFVTWLKHIAAYFTGTPNLGSAPLFDAQGNVIGSILRTASDGFDPVFDKSWQLLGFKQRAHIPLEVESRSKPTIFQQSTEVDAPVPLGKSNKTLSVSNPPDTTSIRNRLGLDAEGHDILIRSFYDWHPWVNDQVTLDLTYAEYNDCEKLLTFWAYESHGVAGNEHSLQWQSGRLTKRQCLGIYHCSDPKCLRTQRPANKKAARERQVDAGCTCGASLCHEPCKAIAKLWFWAKGVHYEHEGHHLHAKPRPVHLTRSEKTQLHNAAASNPDGGPLSLLVGKPGPLGQDSVRLISPALSNIDRIRYELQSLKGTGKWKEDDIVKLQNLLSKYPEFFKKVQIDDEVAVICMQSDFMEDMSYREGRPSPQHINVQAIHGVVTDAAHGFFKSKTSVLIISSSYCDELLMWIPVLMTWSNGQTHVHYEQHWLLWMEGKARRAGMHGHQVEDQLFEAIADFSEAEQDGFTAAFVKFWQKHPDNDRSESQLKEAAKKLIKGCTYHFKGCVVNVSRCSGVVSVDRKNEFILKVFNLITIPEIDDLTREVAEILQQFPKAASFLKWWLRPKIAPRIFSALRDMPEDRWIRLPDTTNAEEAQHFKLYSALGKNHSLISGLEALLYFATYYFSLWLDSFTGKPIRYGEAEPWKRIKELIGTTHPARLPGHHRQRTKNDGRAFDTNEELLGIGKEKHQNPERGEENGVYSQAFVQAGLVLHKKSNKSSTQALKATSIQGYIWHRNSCWLDSSLTVLFYAISCDKPSFLSHFSSVEPETSFGRLFRVMHARQLADESSHSVNGVQQSEIRDSFRHHLFEIGAMVETEFSHQPAFSWLAHIARKSLKTDPKSASYFSSRKLIISSCTGDIERGAHSKVSSPPRQIGALILSELDQKHFKNNVQNWLFSQVDTDPGPQSISCWHARDGKMLCDGESILREFYLSLPVNLVLEPADDCLKNGMQDWNFPEQLALDRDSNKFIYKLVGRVFHNGGHYKARFLTTQNERISIYDYDGMLHNGMAQKLDRATVKSGLSGPDKTLRDRPNGFRTSMAVYALLGGEAMQQEFYRSQIQHAEIKHHLSFSSTSLDIFPSVVYTGGDMDHLPTKSKFWLNLTGWDIDEDSEYVQDPTAYHHIMRTSVEEQSDAEQSDQHSTPPFFDRIKEPSPPIDFTFKPKHPIASLDYNSQLPSSPILDALKRRQQSPSMVSEPPISPNLGNASVLETPKKRKRVEFQTGNKTSKDDPPAPPKKRSKRLAEKGLKRKAQDNQSADEILPPSKKSKIQQASKPTQRTRSMKTRLQKSPNDSDSDDDFSFLCRCGAGANGMRLEASGKAAKCDECGFWSHIACLQGVGGRHSDVRRHVDHWECYICMTPDEAIRRSDAARRVYATSLEGRDIGLCVGRGALVLNGNYYYPARLIEYLQEKDCWTIRWWRGNCFAPDAPYQDIWMDQEISETSIIDALCGDEVGRRRIRLGKWLLGYNEYQSENKLLTDPTIVPYTMEIDRVLSLNISLLKALWTAPETANPTSVPALEEFNRTGNSPLRYGGLTLIDVAGVLNWYAEKIPGASECADEWVNGLAIAHALTLLTISRRRKSFTRLPGCPNKSKTLERRWWILNRAWEALTEEGKVIPVDVDAEAIAILEGLMFANVGEGRTSLRQWSLDSGPIQDNWCPYSEIPSNWEEELMAEL